MINIWVDLKQNVPDLPKDYAKPVQEYATDPISALDCPPLNIVIFIVGSRGKPVQSYSLLQLNDATGDVQPYLSLALRLVENYNHTVRLATHPDFKDFVLDVNKRLKGKTGKDGQDLEGSIQFYDVGGDPKQLMAYMVKSK
jgi:sterol 3beta-glucosyltransferase